ncbi:MAG: hypothetical protein STHCBS139747_006934 [Sporothrix thermara]
MGASRSRGLTRQASQATTDDDYSIRLPPLRLANLLTHQLETASQTPHVDHGQATSSDPGSSGGQDLSAVPPSMRVTFNPLVTYEHGDFAQMRSRENWAATGASSTQVQTSDFPAARFYECPAAVSRPDHAVPDFQVPQQMPAQMQPPVLQHSLQHSSQQLPYHVPHQPSRQIPQTYQADSMVISPRRDRNMPSDSAQRLQSPAEPGLRDYATVIHEIEMRDLARRSMLNGYTAQYLSVAQDLPVEINQQVINQQVINQQVISQQAINSQPLHRNQQCVEVRGGRDESLSQFGEEDFYDGYSESATRLPVNRELATTRSLNTETSAAIRKTESTFDQITTVSQGTGVSTGVIPRDVRTTGMTAGSSNALVSRQQEAILQVQGNRNDSTVIGSHIASSNVSSSNVNRRTSAAGRRPAWALELTARAARASSASSGQVANKE